MHRHRQLHLWVTDHDYGVLRTLANSRQETLSSVIRRLIKAYQPPERIPVAFGAVADPGTCGQMDG